MQIFCILKDRLYLSIRTTWQEHSTSKVYRLSKSLSTPMDTAFE